MRAISAIFLKIFYGPILLFEIYWLKEKKKEREVKPVYD